MQISRAASSIVSSIFRSRAVVLAEALDVDASEATDDFKARGVECVGVLSLMCATMPSTEP